MRIIKNEIKKIFNLRNIVILGLISLMMWHLFIYFEIKYFPNGFPASGSTGLSIEMLNKYGLTMDEDEFEDFKNTRKEREKVADKFIQSYEELTSRGVNNYKEFTKNHYTGDNKDTNKELNEITSKIFFEDDLNGDQILWELEGRDYLIDRYENKDLWINIGDSTNSKKIEIRDEILNSGDYGSPIYFRVLENYDDLILWINTLILISVVFTISPIFLNDNKNKVNYIQYSTKTGRKLFSKKIVVGILSTLVIISIQLAVFFIIYRKNNTYMFWDCKISGVFSDRISWFNITFGQYIILSVVLTYIIDLVVSTLSMVVSSRVSNYMTLIGIQIPILFVICNMLKRIGMNGLTDIYFPKYSLPIIYTVLIIISILLIFKSIKRENSKNI